MTSVLGGKSQLKISRGEQHLGLPLGPKLLHYITLLFRIKFPRVCNKCLHDRIGFELLPGYVISCVVARHTMWTSDFITQLFSNESTGYGTHFYIAELVLNQLCNNFGRNGKGGLNILSSQGRKCGINKFWAKKTAGRFGCGSRGWRQTIYVRIFPNIWSVFGTANRSNINNFRDRRPA